MARAPGVLLLRWYDANARVLPWRLPPGSAARPDPYRVWLAEVMLQQTTVEAVAPRYRAFLDRWPTADALAAAPEEDVMAAWAGLGYYARARALVATARLVAAAGGFPADEGALRALPGVGAYTAAAIAAIAFGQPAVVVDSNVERVAARWFRIDEAPPRLKAACRARLAPLVPADRPGDFAQAMMDLGATICTPRMPACHRCPVAEICLARAAGVAGSLPRRAARRARPLRSGLAWWIEAGGEVALVRRPPRGLLGGMLALPGTPWSQGDGEDALPFPGDWQRTREPVRHGFTHFELALSVAAIRLPERPALDFEAEWTACGTASGLPTVYARAAEAGRRLLEQN